MNEIQLFHNVAGCRLISDLSGSSATYQEASVISPAAGQAGDEHDSKLILPSFGHVLRDI